MYDELVKRLKDFAAGTMRDEDAQLAFDAADAIELQQKLLDGLEADNDSLCEKVAELQAYVALYKDGGETAVKVANDYKARIEELSAIREEQKAQIIAMAAENKPRWIPVAERLPEEYKDVLCYYEYFRYGDYNCMFRTIDRGYYGNGIWGGEAGQGHKNKVLAWMPLPEPPKEGFMKNGDAIRSMTDEELAEWMANKAECQYCSVRSEWCTESEASCRTNWLDWLKEEASN